MNGLCECGCGQETWGGKRFVRGHHMRTAEARERNGIRKSSEPLRRDLSTQRFQKLTVVSWSKWLPYKHGRESAWLCRCDCGKECVVPQKNLVSGKTKSCGCIIGQHKRTHGATVGGKPTPEFMAWEAMRQRCENPRVKAYKDYGGRGIKVCERWSTFENFLADMGIRPSSDHSLDRYPNNDGNYEPGNCRWATRDEQGNNRRSSRRVEFNGESLTLAEWEHRVGLKPGMLFRRLAAGWPMEQALSPADHRRSSEPT